MAKQKGSRGEELQDLRDWCVAIIRFMGELSPSDLFAQTEDAINAAFDRGDLRGLKMVSKDVGEWATGLASSDQKKLDEALRSQFGRGLREDVRAVRDEVARILKRGTIGGEEEYRLLSSRADEIYADDSKQSELKRINALLAEYEAS
jgi:hypothetical protein